MIQTNPIRKSDNNNNAVSCFVAKRITSINNNNNSNENNNMIIIIIAIKGNDFISLPISICAILYCLVFMNECNAYRCINIDRKE